MISALDLLARWWTVQVVKLRIDPMPEIKSIHARARILDIADTLQQDGTISDSLMVRAMGKNKYCRRCRLSGVVVCFGEVSKVMQPLLDLSDTISLLRHCNNAACISFSLPWKFYSETHPSRLSSMNRASTIEEWNKCKECDHRFMTARRPVSISCPIFLFERRSCCLRRFSFDVQRHRSPPHIFLL